MTEAGRLVLPDFCAARSVLAVLLIVALTALLLTLASGTELPGFWLELARTSLFLVWIGLCGAALLCATRTRLAHLPVQQAAAVVLALMAAIIALVSEVAWRIGHSLFDGPGVIGLFPHDHLPFLLRNVAIGVLVTALALRYFYVTQQWRLNVEIQARARVTALQARIRPHFLYNSLNTIAQLTRSDPSSAEEAIEDLSDLFRASLSEHRGEITLGEELEIARAYQRIEALRLGVRLRVDWQVDELPLATPVPGLMIQPLLENAIGHGIERLPEGGTVRIDGALVDDLVRFTVRNPLPFDVGAAPARTGFGLALGNIRERLALRYGARARVVAGRQGDDYVVELVFPVKPPPPAGSGS